MKKANSNTDPVKTGGVPVRDLGTSNCRHGFEPAMDAAGFRKVAKHQATQYWNPHIKNGNAYSRDCFGLQEFKGISIQLSDLASR